MIKPVFVLILGAALCSSGCQCPEDAIDMSQANRRVILNSLDLQNFKRLANIMVQDSSKIRKQQENLTTASSRAFWLGTNSYYLYQLDSAKYSALLTPLKGKWKDQLYLSQSGEIQFVLKESTQMKCDTYNDSYTHVLASFHKERSDLLAFGDIQETYVDAVMDTNWRYLYFKSHTGH
ncbi:MAG TPA: hypothetical protein VK563_20700 [Puia sp.]|nr:hypothetical protein [Puia sp.]